MYPFCDDWEADFYFKASNDPKKTEIETAAEEHKSFQSYFEEYHSKREFTFTHK